MNHIGTVLDSVLKDIERAADQNNRQEKNDQEKEKN